jgi:hypothetical protein
VALSDQEMATEITKTVCVAVFDKQPLDKAEAVGQAVATIYKIVFEAVKASDDG